MMRAVMAKLSGCRRRAAISTPWRRVLFHGLVDQPSLPAPHQIAQDQARGRVPPLDAPHGETRPAHRREHDRFVGAGRDPRDPGIAVERV